MIISTQEKFVQPEIESVSFGDKVRYQLVDDYSFEFTDRRGVRRKRIVFRIDPNTSKVWTTDLASVPDFGALLGFRSDGTSDGAAVLHDRGYQTFADLKRRFFTPGESKYTYTKPWPVGDVWTQDFSQWTRYDCDWLYRLMCECGGMPKWRANAEWLALRAGAVDFKHGLGWYFS